MSTKRHTALNLCGAVAPILLMLVTVPLYLRLVGEERYGVLAIVWLITGYFGFFDFGLGRATAHAVAKARNLVDEVRARTFWTALLVNAALGVVGGLLVLIIAPPLFTRVFNISGVLLDEVLTVVPWVALAIPLLTFQGVFTGALTGRERFLALNVRSVIGTALTQLVPLACVWLIAPTLEVAIPSTVIARLVSVTLLAAIAFRSVPAGWRPCYGGHPMARELLGYGGWISLSGVMAPLIASMDRFLIAGMLNPVAVTHYSVPFQLVTRGSTFASALSNAMFPRLVRSTHEEARALAWRAIKANAGLMLVPCVIGIVIMKPFLTLWVGPGFAEEAAIVGQLIAISLWLNAIALIPFNLLQAQGKPRETTAILAIQVIPFLAVAVPGITFLGIAGAALARNVRSAADVALLCYRTQFLKQLGILSLPPLALLISAVLLQQVVDAPGATQTMASAFLILAAMAWALATSKDVRQLIAVLFRDPVSLFTANKP